MFCKILTDTEVCGRKYLLNRHSFKENSYRLWPGMKDKDEIVSSDFSSRDNA